MSGRQFNFFLGPSDQVAFDEALRTSGDIAFIKDRSTSPKPEEQDSSVIHDLGKEPFRVLIARREDIANIRFRPIKGCDEFSCSVTSQLVIEFDRFFGNSRFIRAGRLYRIDKYWGDDGKLVSKPDAFIEWGDRLYKLAKKSLIKVEQGCFAGKEALEMRRAGAAFEGLDITMGSID